jgi:hypothetical protein
MTPPAYTFGTGLVSVAILAWIVIWVLVAVRVFRRPDLGVGGKVAWIVVILLLPILGLLAYFLWDAARPART